MGTTITIDSSQSEKNKGGTSGGSKPQSIYLQLIPAQVEHVILSSDDLGYYEPSDINVIFAKKHAGEEIDYSQTSKNKYYPMFRGMVDTPNKEDQVLIYDGEAGQDYYLGPLNSLNNPNFNIDPLRKTQTQINRNTKANNSSEGTVKSKLGMSENYKPVPIKRLSVRRNKKLDDPKNIRIGEDGSIAKEETFGDMIFEGRYNNSIRLGYRYTDPLIFISNGRRVNQDQETFVDNSLIAMTTRGALSDHLFPTNPNTPFPNFILGSETIELENPRLVGGGNPDLDGGVDGKFNYNYGNDDEGNPIKAGQLFMNSDRLVFNARKDTITLSAFHNLDMGTGNNLTINTKNYTSIESSNIYLGKQAQERKEPLVLGEQLRLILEEMVGILEIFKVTGTAAGISGTPAPDVVAKLTTLKNKLSSPTFFSQYHFIEDNGQKVESVRQTEETT